MKCKAQDCIRPIRSKGMCDMHYQRFKKQGTMYTERVRESHGLTHLPEYEVWKQAIRRCHTPTDKRYARYGGRGIKVCDRWRHSFTNFLEDMGRRPSQEHSLDRENNDGDYSPDNCRWATEFQQQNNRGNNRLVTIDGRTQTLSEWIHELNLSDTRVRDRITKLNWPIKKALELNNA